MNLTYYPFAPFKIEAGKINILDFGNSKMYFDFCQGFSDHTDLIRVSNEDLELLTTSSQCSWYGDLMLSVDLNRLFLKKIQARLIELLSEEQQVALLDQSRTVVSSVMDVSFLLDLPIEVSELPDVEKVMKFVGIDFPKDVTTNPSAVLETLVQTHLELGIEKSIVLTNVSHYLNCEQLQHIEQLVQHLGVTVIVIEYSESNRMEKFQDSCYYYVDEDLVDWRDMS